MAFNVLIIGGSGLGKSFLTNKLLGINKAVESAAAVGCTRSYSLFSSESINVIDTPGLGDMVQNSDDILSDEDISYMVEEIILSKPISCIVFVIPNEVVTSPRSGHEYWKLADKLRSLIDNLEEIVVFAIKCSGGFMEIEELYLLVTARQTQVDRVHSLGVSLSADGKGNVALFQNEIIPRMREANKILYEKIRKHKGNKACLKSKNPQYRCDNCGAMSISGKCFSDCCKVHLGLRHGSFRTVKGHPKGTEWYHPGSWTKISKNNYKYNCCQENSGGCRQRFTCCYGIDPCSRVCADCDRYEFTPGCLGKCSKCGQSGTDPCTSQKHDFRRL